MTTEGRPGDQDSVLEELDRTYRTNLPGVFMHQAFHRWPALAAEVRQLQEELRVSRGADAEQDSTRAGAES